ncbi:hypothetical protein GEU84_000905 [Fertoebacter nigrum]|uniref:Tetratricopeptide repeat protein n=1 Tax=Fertoeibacter niger TaxID=2656921 RepID=A0A8X8H4R8_9RHOB|nr:tetratricopeptide repeat protein [Fertoeibacter niger]NUB42931.1 hypothetical protein [Fertoeibacter niger]
MLRMLTGLAVMAVAVLPHAAFAVGTDDDEPPKPTETTTTCTDGKVWDEATKTCTDAKDARLNDDTRFRAARELAYAGQPDAALQVLAAMTEGETGRVLTYMGFAHRMAGRLEEGQAAYDRALVLDPGNILARSYMGQGFVVQGEIELANLQLAEIRQRGGAGSWAETALAHAIATGVTYNH